MAASQDLSDIEESVGSDRDTDESWEKEPKADVLATKDTSTPPLARRLTKTPVGAYDAHLAESIGSIQQVSLNMILTIRMQRNKKA